MTHQPFSLDPRWDGNAVAEYCLSKIDENREYLNQNYPSVKEWICSNKNGDCHMDDILQIQLNQVNLY